MAQGPGEMGTASCSLLWGGGYQAGKTSQPRCEVGQTRGLTEEASYWAGHSRGFRSLPGASGKSQTFLWAKLTLYCTQVPPERCGVSQGLLGRWSLPCCLELRRSPSPSKATGATEGFRLWSDLSDLVPLSWLVRAGRGRRAAHQKVQDMWPGV